MSRNPISNELWLSPCLLCLGGFGGDEEDVVTGSTGGGAVGSGCSPPTSLDFAEALMHDQRRQKIKSQTDQSRFSPTTEKLTT